MHSPERPSRYRQTIWTAVSAIVIIVAILLAPAAYRRLGTVSLSGIPISRTTTTVPSIQRFSTAATPSSTSQTSNMPCKSMSAEDKQWNILADNMDRYHNHFRYEFDRVYRLCDGGFQREGMSLQAFLREAQDLNQHLHMHHTIEAYIFPILAKKMPQFKDGARESGLHLQSHKAIHEGLDKYSAFLKTSLANPNTYSAATLREIMLGFKDVLFRHLDEEVHDLGAESMKAAGWTLAELKKFPM